MNAVQTASVPLGGVDAGGPGSQSPVLRVIVENLFYPVTLEVLHQVTARLSCPLLCLILLTVRITSSISVSSSAIDLLKVWHSAEDHHFYQKQSVPGFSSVLGRHDSSALQAGEQINTHSVCKLYCRESDPIEP